MPFVRGGVCADPDFMVGVALHAESLGFESIVAVEHPLVIGGYASRYPYADSGRMPLPNDTPIPDPLDLLAFVAGATTTIGLATGVLILPAHHPVTLAKRIATVDVLSKGRLRLVIGVGWMREELEATGAEFATRGRRTDESIDVLRALWADSGEEGASFHGEFFGFSAAHSYPKPAQPGGVPLHIGGHSPASIRRAALAGDGWAPLGLRGDELAEALASLRTQALAAGRDPDAIEVTLPASAVHVTVERVEEMEALGAHRIALAIGGTELAEACEELSALAERVGLGGR